MSADDQGHNGWRNYETWAANLHISNDQGSVIYWEDAAREAIDAAENDPTFTRRENALFALRDRLKEEYEAACPAVEGMYEDLLLGALGEIDWREIAEHMIDAAWTAEDDIDPRADIEEDETADA
jgi:hypothetical protein